MDTRISDDVKPQLEEIANNFSAQVTSWASNFSSKAVNWVSTLISTASQVIVAIIIMPFILFIYCEMEKLKILFDKIHAN